MIDDTRSIEARGIELAMKHMPRKRIQVNGESSRNVPALQTLYGDFFIENKSGDILTIEVKTEEKHTGNLFLEVWSNEPMKTPGWIYTLQADYLWYNFLENEHQYVIDLADLQRWAFADGKLGKYRHVEQSKHQQRNVTVGAIVPIKVLEREVGFFKTFGVSN